MFGHRLRRWPNIKSAVAQLPVFVGCSGKLKSIAIAVQQWRMGIMFPLNISLVLLYNYDYDSMVIYVSIWHLFNTHGQNDSRRSCKNLAIF